METKTLVLLTFGIAIFSSMLLYLAERAAIASLGSFLFRVGFTVKTFQQANINLNQFSIGRVYETAHAKFRRVSEESCFFCYRVGRYELYTPFPIKGEIVGNESETLLIWRIPLGSTLFLGLAMFGLLALTLSRAILISDLGFSLPLFLVSILGTCLLIWFSARLERKHAHLALSELISFSLSK
jgi:hypothetical protein